jgi:hypothetical protein
MMISNKREEDSQSSRAGGRKRGLSQRFLWIAQIQQLSWLDAKIVRGAGEENKRRVRRLLDRGADIEAEEDENGQAALKVACLFFNGNMNHETRKN